MSAEFHIYCPHSDDAGVVANSLRELMIDDVAALNVAVEGSKIVLSWRPSDDPSRLESLLKRSDGIAIRFGDIVHTLEGSASGVHRREGALWIRNGQHRVVDGRVAVTDIAPTLLDLLNVAQPSHMQGRSLLAGSSKEEAIAS